MAKTANRPPRAIFSFYVPEGISTPRGSVEALDRALSRLGPFKYNTANTARQHNFVRNAYGYRVLNCRAEAVSLVKNLASLYLDKAYSYIRAPRAKEQLNSLIAAEQSIPALMSSLSDLDDTALIQIHTVAEMETRYAELAITANLSELPPRYERSGGRTIWTERLHALQLLLKAAIELTQTVYGGDQGQVIDRGGNISVLTAIGGNPRHVLAAEGLAVFNLFSADAGSSYGDGDFHEFINDVFELATDEEGGTHGKMIHWIKRAVKDERDRKHKIKTVRARIAALEAKKSTANAAKIESALKTLREDELLLGPILEVFSYGQST
jgi:hypothetical protein